jgi:hypothetical protein
MADARDFFQARQTQWTWTRLQSLALISFLLSYIVDLGNISDLLQDAAAAALCMPRLRVMALWNGGKRLACGFVFCLEYDHPSIVLRSTWDMQRQPRVIQAWEQVTSRYTPHKLQGQEQRLWSDAISSHGDTIHHLDLPREVIDPVSLWQIRRECAG